MKTSTLMSELHRQMDVYWRATHDLSAGRICPVANGAVLPTLPLNGLPDFGKSSTVRSTMNCQFNNRHD